MRRKSRLQRVSMESGILGALTCSWAHLGRIVLARVLRFRRENAAIGRQFDRRSMTSLLNRHGIPRGGGLLLHRQRWLTKMTVAAQNFPQMLKCGIITETAWTAASAGIINSAEIRLHWLDHRMCARASSTARGSGLHSCFSKSDWSCRLAFSLSSRNSCRVLKVNRQTSQ